MPGLRDLPTFPATGVQDLPGSDYSAESSERAGASEVERGARSAALTDQAGSRMQAALEAARGGDHATALKLHGEAQDLMQQAAAWAPSTPSVSDVHNVGDATSYAAGQLGAGLRTTAPSVAAAIAAAAAARYGLRLPSSVVTGAGAVGGAIPAYGMAKHSAVLAASQDSAAMERNTPDQILDEGTGVGLVNAGLQAALPAVIAGRTVGAAVGSPTLRGVAATVGKDMALQAGTQAGTELTNQAGATDLNPDRDKSGDLQHIVDAAVSGAVTAPALGAHTHIIDATRAIIGDVQDRMAQPQTPATGRVESPNADSNPQAAGEPLDFPEQGPLSPGRASWLDRSGLRAPADIAAKGASAVGDWLRGQDQDRYDYVAGALGRAGEGAADLAQRFKENASGTYNDAVGYLKDSGVAQRATGAIQGLAKAGQDFVQGLRGKNEQYDATDRTLFDLFHDNIPQSVSRDSDSMMAADMMRRFAKGDLDPSLGTHVARSMIQAYGDEAPRVATEAAQVLERGGTPPEDAQRLPKLMTKLLGDDDNRSALVASGISGLLSNDTRLQFKEATGRTFGDADLARVTDALDRVAQGDNTHIEGLHELFGDKLEQAVNVARAAHDAAHQDVSGFTEALRGHTQGEEGESAQKAVDKSAPPVYSFKRGEGKDGIGEPFHATEDRAAIDERKATLTERYPGSTVTEVPAERYAREEGVTPSALGHDLKDRVVLRTETPTNEDALKFTPDDVKKLVKPTAMTREVRAGDETRGERYTVQTGKDGRRYTEIRRPGSDEGAMYVALNKADGTPLEREGKRQYGMVRTDDLVREMGKRDRREGVTSSTAEGGERDLQLLLSGLSSLASAEGTAADVKHGLVFLSADGKSKRVAFAGEKTHLPADLKVGKSTVAEIKSKGISPHAELQRATLEKFSGLGRGDTEAALASTREAALETKEITPGTEGAAHIAEQVEKHGFPTNLRENLTAEQKAALSAEDGSWQRYVDHALGTTGAKRELYNHFFTEKGYSRLTERARSLRQVLPELERRGELIEKGETLDRETGLPVRNDTDNALEEQAKPRALEPDEELGQRTRAQDTSFRKRNAQAADQRPLTEEERTKIADYVHRTLGPDVKVAFEEHLGSAGEWTSDDTGRTMKIAITTGVNGMSVAQHEALHGFFEHLMKNGHDDVVDTLTSAASAGPVRKQLERLLENEPAALRQLASPEERAAYAYQFWVASKAGLVDFRLGPKTEGVFGKIAAFFRKVVGMTTVSDRAGDILQAFHDGKMAEPSAVGNVLAELRAARPDKWPTLRTMAGTSMRKMSGWLTPAYNDLVNSQNGAAGKIAEAFYTDPTSSKGGQGFLQARQQQAATWLNRYSTVLEGVSKESLEGARDVLQGKTAHVPDGDAARVVNLTRDMLRGFFRYMKEAGVDVGMRRNYFPRVWDLDKITGDADQFKNDLLTNHREDLEGLGKSAFDAAEKQWKARQAQGLQAGERPSREDFAAEKTAEHILATLSVQRGYVADEGEGKTRITESAARPGFTPFMAAVNARTLNFLDMKVFGKYLKDDMVNIISTYVSQGVRRAEYARRFGSDGEHLASMMNDAVTEETARVRAEMPAGDAAAISKEVASRTAQYARSIMAMEGTLGYDISPTWRRVNSAMVVYQNLRLLPLSLFSSLIDAQGVMVRGATMGEALSTFKRGLADVTRFLHTEGAPEDAGEKLSQMLGTVENKVLLDSLGETYSSVYLYGWARRLNEQLFKFNGMEAWNRAMRVGATQAAVGFIGRHARGEDPTHSTRWLSELGLTKDDVHFNTDGSLKVFPEEGLSAGDAAKIRVAVQRFVDSAILRPNAAQRPAWASDPHYAMFFHLKQFTYSFHHVILKRVAHEWVNGNLTPGLVLASYVPVMIAADIARGFIQGGGQQPDWKKKWGLGDYVESGVQRAGLLGIGQFALDAKNMGVGALGGPAVEQVTSAATDPAYNTFVRSLPANPAYRDMLLGHSKSPQRGQRDLSDLQD